MSQILVRFLVSGAVVSTFAIIGDLLKPESFGLSRNGLRLWQPEVNERYRDISTTNALLNRARTSTAQR